MNPISGFQSIPSTITSGTTSSQTQGGESFLDTLQSAMGGVEQAQNEAQQSVTSMLKGDGEEVHKTMIAVEKADLSFQLMMEVRNKIISAYQDVSKMAF